MTIHIPKPIAILLVLVLGGGAVALLVSEFPDLIRYLKQVEGL